MPDLGKGVRRRRADPVGGAVGPLEIRETRLDGGIAALEFVVFCIRDNWGVGLMVSAIGVCDLAGKLFQFLTLQP